MAVDQIFDDLWEQALDEYFTSTDRTHVEQKLLKRLRTPDDLQQELEAEFNKFINFRAKGSKLTAALKSAVHPFMMLSGIVSSALSPTPFAPASAVLGAVVFVIKAAKGVSEVFDWIEQLFYKLSDFTARLDEYVEAGISVRLRTKVVQILACLLEILASSEKVIKSGRWKKFAAVLFLGQDEHVKASFDKLTGLFEDEQQLVNAINYAKNQKMYNTVQEIEQTGKQTLETTEEVKSLVMAVHQKQNLDEILDWISSGNFVTQHSNYLDQRQTGTAQWFLDDVKFRNWMNASKQTLFCPGLPGSGKTMMAAITIDFLLKAAQKDKSIGIAYVYCDYKRRASQSTKSLLAAVLRQLVQTRDEIPDSISTLYDSKGKRTSGIQRDDIKILLKSILADQPRPFIIIDALDECIDENEKRIYVELLEEIRTLQFGSTLNLLVTSRFNPDIERIFEKDCRLEIRATDDDIERFADAQLDQQPVLEDDHDLRYLVESKVAEAAGGMFLIAKLNIEWLREMTTIKEIKKALQSLSQSSPTSNEPLHIYKVLYDRTIERIDAQLPSRRNLAHRVLAWLTFACRPLKTEELLHALAIEIGEDYFDKDNIPRIEIVVSVCTGLVTVDENGSVVRLVHYTTQEYLEQVRHDWLPEAEEHIASACFTYLSYKSFREGSCLNSTEFRRRLKRYPFFDYAARYWVVYTKRVEKEVCKLAFSFLKRPGSVSSAYQAASARRSLAEPVWTKPLPRDFLGIHLAARQGLVSVSRLLVSEISQGVSDYINSKDSFQRTPLELAAYYGRYSMVEFLLQIGADPNYNASTAVSSSTEDHERAWQSSVLNGKNISLEGWNFTPLAAAASYDHYGIMKLLLQSGADVNASGWYGTALQAASYRGHTRGIQLLLENGADPNAKGWQYGTALQIAAENGHEGVVQMLLKHNADVNASGGWYGTALQAASLYGNDEVVRILLDHGADVNAPATARYGTALQLASKRGHKKVIQMLLDAGSKPNQ